MLVIQDGSEVDARDVVTPGVLGLELALEGSGLRTRVVEVDAFDPAAARSDAEVVAVVVAPFTAVRADELEALRAAGLSVLSLSELSEPGATEGAPFRAAAPPIAAQASAATDAGASCSAGDGSTWSEAFAEALAPMPALPLGAAEATGAAAERGCAAVVWTGAASGGVELANLLAAEVPGTTLILGDRARTPGAAGTTTGEGVRWGLCPCADLSTSSDPAAQAFLHAYQATHGLDAGPYSVEGYDVGRLVASAAHAGSTRQAIAAALAEIERFEGLAGTYTWTGDGVLADPVVRMYERVGIRWLERPPVRVARDAMRA